MTNKQRIEHYQALGFDSTTCDDEYTRIKCSQCEVLVIQGIATHEIGCPNSRKLKERKHQVVVGNIGTVYSGSDAESAENAWTEYVKQSQSERGRAGGEDVTWFLDDEIHQEHLGTLDKND